MKLYRPVRAVLLCFSLLFCSLFSATALASTGGLSADYDRADLKHDYTAKPMQLASLSPLPDVLVSFKSLPAHRELFTRRVEAKFNLPLELYLNRRTALLMDAFLKDSPDVGVMFGFRITGNLTQI